MGSFRGCSLFLAAFVFFAAVLTACGATFNVADGDVAALKNAILAANINNQDDTINLASGGQYLLTAVDNGAEDALPIIADDNGNVLTINGQGSTIQCQTNLSTLPYLRIFDVVGNAIIANLTLQNARARDSGAAIQNGSGELTVANCTFSANKSFYLQSSGLSGPRGGAALCNIAGTVTVTGCTFSGNEADNDNNGSAEGGAIFNAGPMVVLNCTFTGNIASSNGGAIHNSNTIMVRNCTFTGNSAQSSFNPNGSDFSGGGIFNIGASATVQNCTFASNRAFEGGAVTNSAPFSASSAMTVSSCTLSDNPSNNGYVFSHNSSAHLSTITIRNSLLQSPGYTDLGVNGAGATIVSQGYNLSDGNGGGFLNGPADQTLANAKLDPAGLQNNGGPTQTIALTANSPAIDKGNSFGLPTDQRGQARPVDLPSLSQRQRR